MSEVPEGWRHAVLVRRYKALQKKAAAANRTVDYQTREIAGLKQKVAILEILLGGKK